MYMFCIRVHIYNFCLLKPQTYCINSDIWSGKMKNTLTLKTITVYILYVAE